MQQSRLWSLESGLQPYYARLQIESNKRTFFVLMLAVTDCDYGLDCHFLIAKLY
ncbi:hypothetical protein NSMM_540061 [Nitrosomonas mobilis]|uniref:Uncharacterized protein n=1 Tax=Nitrosomonas mobilis TaxID=51642 RepID=A0A1G5SH67_9PROT|nr:hypothetical protein NSMM_540061 [Nitrosomonas mobilis]